MRMPGRAWLDFEVTPDPANASGAPSTTPRSLIRQTAVFDPVGLGGLVYWYALLPIHAWIFRSMLKGIARAAEQRSCDERTSCGSLQRR
jgi:hypothetical protein